MNPINADFTAILFIIAFVLALLELFKVRPILTVSYLCMSVVLATFVLAFNAATGAW